MSDKFISNLKFDHECELVNELWERLLVDSIGVLYKVKRYTKNNKIDVDGLKDMTDPTLDQLIGVSTLIIEQIQAALDKATDSYIKHMLKSSGMHWKNFRKVLRSIDKGDEKAIKKHATEFNRRLK